jgi:hypothetical protein
VIPTDFAYLAGLIDGDGYVTIYRRTSRNQWTEWSAFIRIVNTHPGIKDLAELGGGTRYTRSRPQRGRTKELWCIQWYGANAYALAEGVLPFIRLKRPQMELVLRFRDTFQGWRKHNPVPPEILADRLAIRDAMGEANQQWGRPNHRATHVISP